MLTTDREVIAMKSPLYKKRVEAVLERMRDAQLPRKGHVTQHHMQECIIPSDLNLGSHFLGFFMTPAGREAVTSTLPLLLAISRL